MIAHVGFVRMRVRFEQVFRGHQHAGGAEPTLERRVLNERLLQRIQRAVRRGQPLDRADMTAVRGRGQDQTGQNRLAIHQHRARAALPDPAAVLGPGQLQILAQYVEQQIVVGDVEMAGDAVDGERDCVMRAA